MTYRSILVFLFICYVSSVSANTDPFSFPLQENQKLVNTFSTDWQQNISLHFAILKNRDSKTYDIQPFYVSEESNIQKLKPVTLDEEPEIMSLHVDNGAATTLLKLKNGIEVVDFSLDGSSTTNFSLGKETQDYKTILRSDGFSCLVNYADNNLKLIIIENSKSIRRQVRRVEKPIQQFFDDLYKNSLQTVETMEYLDKSSISESKCYADGDKLYFTLDNSNQASTSIVAIDITNNDPIDEAYRVGTFNEDMLKDYNSFLVGNELFGISVGKEDFQLQISELGDDSLKKITINTKDLIDQDIKGDFETFSKMASKNRNRPTVVVNPTKDGSLKVKMSYVDKNQYQYNWWFHNWMFQNMMWQQQMMMQQHMNRTLQSLPKFGPAASDDMLYFSESSLEFLIAPDGVLQSGDSVETIYKAIDKEPYLERFRKTKAFKDLSVSFRKEGYSIIYFDPSYDNLEIRYSKYD